MIPLKQLPQLSRPRERLQRDGVSQLSLEDLIAILIRTGSKESDVLQLSYRISDYLVSGYKNVHDLARIPGVGPTKAAVVSAAIELSKSLTQRSNTLLLSDPHKVYLGCQDLLSLPQEHLVVFYLTVRNQQIARETISIGTATASLIHPREVFRPAIQHNASHIVLAHNHPSGDPSPSAADKEVTLRIAQAGRQLDIELVDHVICGKEDFISLKSSFSELFF